MTDLKTEKQAKNKARIATALVGLLVILSLFFISFTIDEEIKEQEEGILVNFGSLDVGSGEIQPENIAESFAKEAQEVSEEPLALPKEASEPKVEEVNDQPVTQKEESVKITEENKKQEQPKEQSEEKITESQQKQSTDDQKQSQPTVNQRDLYPGKKTTNSSGEGVTGDEGDQGNVTGVPDEGAYEGTNSGLGDSGVGYSLRGRKMIQSPSLTDRSNAVGKITIDIKVNQNGDVIDASLGTPTTISNSGLVSKAISAAKRAKFNKNASASEEQFGTITFVFKVT